LSKTKKIGFLVIVAFSSIALLVWRLFLHDIRPYLHGDVIRLIDELDNDNIRRTPLGISLKTIRGERLNKGWKKLAVLGSGVGIWQTYAAQFIVTVSDQSPDNSTRIYRDDQILHYKNNLFGEDTTAGCWNSEADRVFISASKGEDPSRSEYFMDYRAFKKLKLDMIDKENLDNPVPFAVIQTRQGPRRLTGYPLRYPAWVQSIKAAPDKITVHRNGRVLPFQADLPGLNKAIPAKTLSVYPKSPSSSGMPFALFTSSDSLTRRIHVAPGPYIIRFVAKASLAGAELPLAVIKIGGQEIAREPITTEDWKTYQVQVSIQKPKVELSLGYANDYFDPQTHRDRNIFISEVGLQPVPKLGAPRPPANQDDFAPATWSWLDDSLDVIYEATAFGMLSIFSQKDTYSSRRTFRPGIVSFVVTAKADLAGPEYPRLALYLNNKRVGAIQITDDAFHEYCLENIPVAAGWHKFKTVFENDFVDPRTRKDRNIFLTRIAMKYDTAVLVSEPLDQPAGHITIRYPSKAPYLAQLRIYREFSAKEAGRINPVSYRVDLAMDVRNALVCPPQTNLTYRIQVPTGGKFSFGYGAAFYDYAQSEQAGGSGSAQLVIKAKEAFHSSQTIFSVEVSRPKPNKETPWKEAKIELDKFAGKKVELSIETRTLSPNHSVYPFLYISNPVILSGSHPSMKEPSIILIAADALRADHLGCYGYGRRTSPAIDQFARESVLFEDAFSQASWTLPALASVFTSLYPSFHGATVWTTRLSSSIAPLPQILKRNGYATAATVNNPYLYPLYGLSEGFDFYSYGQSNIEDELQTITQRLNSLGNRKFFFFIHFLSPHSPYQAPHPFGDAFGASDDPKLDASNSTLNSIETSGRRLSADDRNYLISQYDGKLLYLDDVLNRLFTRVKQLGLYENTLIIFLSDHGEQFQEHGHLLHGNSLYQEELRVPLIMKLPSSYGLAAGRFPGTVRSIDIPATILDLIHVPLPDSFQGRSLAPFLREKPFEDDVAFAELNTAGLLAIRKGPYKYIAKQSQQGSGAQKKPGSPTGQSGDLEELFDLIKDSSEMHNLSASRLDILEIFRREKKTLMEFSARFHQNKPGSTQDNGVILDATTRERLRALGYLR
jgi:arylsulfatase A-like enzyme